MRRGARRSFAVAWLALAFAACVRDPSPAPPPTHGQHPNDFFFARAAAERRGAYPRYFSREQVYWTAIGADGDDRSALLSEDGALEPARRSFTIEPFLAVDGRFVSWADAEIEHALRDGDLPIPRVVWRARPIDLTTRAFVAGLPGASVLYATYRLANHGGAPSRADLWLGIRPFQVNPPWQSLNGAGGATAVHRIAREGRVVRVNGRHAIALLTPPDAFGAARLDQGGLADFLARGALAPGRDAVFDAGGFASAAARWRFTLAPGQVAEVVIAVPLHEASAFLAALPRAADAAAHAAAAEDATARRWRARLSRAEIALPPASDPIVPALRAALGQILVARAGPALQPGTRTYARAWIRDGVLMESALLQLGVAETPRDFVHWYAPFQEPDGRVPCCVDERGRDTAVEHDSPGQLLYGIASLWRYERDVETVRALWPHVPRTVDYIERLRAQRLGPEWAAPAKRRFRGLLPESISHEGYWQNPVHSYWDDAWALRGLADAALLARVVGGGAAAQRFAALERAFAKDLRASIEATMAHHRVDFVPASADLGDFDPTATTIWLAPGRARGVLPPAALERTYERYVDDVRGRRAGAIAWDAYAPYELRNVEALVRLGRRDDALFVLREILGDQRPPGWRGWSEIVWRDPRAPQFLGDMPHAWISATYARAVRSLLVYERDDGALVLGAGVPLDWLRGEGVRVARLPTHWGPLAYRMREAGERRLVVEIDAGVERPPGGVVVEPPVAIRAARVDGAPAETGSARAVTATRLPARIEIDY